MDKNTAGLLRIIERYGQLDAEIVWATVVDDIPELHKIRRANYLFSDMYTEAQYYARF